MLRTYRFLYYIYYIIFVRNVNLFRPLLGINLLCRFYRRRVYRLNSRLFKCDFDCLCFGLDFGLSARAFGAGESGLRFAEVSGVGYADHADPSEAVCRRLLCSSPFSAVLRNVS